MVSNLREMRGRKKARAEKRILRRREVREPIKPFRLSFSRFWEQPAGKRRGIPVTGTRRREQAKETETFTLERQKYQQVPQPPINSKAPPSTRKTRVERRRSFFKKRRGRKSKDGRRVNRMQRDENETSYRGLREREERRSIP